MSVRPLDKEWHAMGPQIVTPVPRWQQVADYLRQEILSGRFRAGQPLPSEETLAAEFAVSRPTIRQGVAALVAEGLLSVRRPYGTIVHDPHARPARTDRRELTRTSTGYREPDAPAWTDAGEPVFVRVDATAAHADLLAIPAGQPMLTREVAQRTDDGQHRLTRLFVPFSVAAELDTPWADDPRLPPPVEVYGWLAEHGHPPQFTEHVRARMPVGDESRALRTRPGVPLLVILRLAHTGRALALEEIRLPADQTELAYPLPVTGDRTPRRRQASKATGR
jgi:GntR family transcriptional regulator